MNDKSVLISIQPQWCKLIANGEKTLEVRKTKPKVNTPFKVYIYCTNGNVLARLGMRHYYFNAPRSSEKKLANSGGQILNGKVIGEFICDTIKCMDIPYPAYSGELDRWYIEKSCIDYDALHRYCGHGNLYFWHILNLQIYDKPKELSDFKPWKRECLYEHLGFAIPKCEECLECKVKRPPQSWCYINEEE